MSHREWRRTYRCPVCGHETVSLANKKQHIKDNHPKQVKP